MLPARVALSFLLMSGAAVAQQYTISTFAGGGLPQNIQGVAADLGSVGVAAVDPAGNVFIASFTYHLVWRLDAKTGLLTVVAGNGTCCYPGDRGPATSAQFFDPSGAAMDAAGNLYISDFGFDSVIRKISADGTITTVAGNGTSGFGGDNGAATSAQL